MSRIADRRILVPFSVHCQVLFAMLIDHHRTTGQGVFGIKRHVKSSNQEGVRTRRYGGLSLPGQMRVSPFMEKPPTTDSANGSADGREIGRLRRRTENRGFQRFSGAVGDPKRQTKRIFFVKTSVHILCTALVLTNVKRWVLNRNLEVPTKAAGGAPATPDRSPQALAVPLFSKA